MLYLYLEQNNLLNHYQGFWKIHSCIDILTYLEHHIQIALRKQGVILIVFLDIEKASASASPLAILYALFNRYTRGRMLR